MPVPKTVFGKSLASLLRRPDIDIKDLLPLHEALETLSVDELEVLQLEIKYAGYIQRESERIEQRERLKQYRIPESMDYGQVAGLKLEAREKLERIRPETLEAAGRISGVDPGDIDLILMYVRRVERSARSGA